MASHKMISDDSTAKLQFNGSKKGLQKMDIFEHVGT